MKKIPLLAALIAITTFLHAQTYLTQVKPMDKKEWGYMNEKGEIVIQPLYRKCYEFTQDGRAAVIMDKKLILLSPDGKQQPTADASLAMDQGKGFYDGLMAVKNKEGKRGFINTNGEIAIDLKYDDVTMFHGGYALAKKGGVTYVINTSGDEVQTKHQGTEDLKPFQNGLSPVRDAANKWGYINTKGELAIPVNFSSVGYFSNGLAWARHENGSIGYINTAGEWAIQPQFTVGKEFDPVSGMARVKIEDKWMYTDAAGTLMTMTDSDKWENFSDGLAMGRKNDLIGFFDKEGKWVISPSFEAARDFKNGYAAVRLNGKWGFIDNTGEVVVPCNYAGVKDMELASKY
jgi:hypothetical protein